MSSKQKSIKDHFKPLKSNELVEIQPNIYPIFRTKVIGKKTKPKPKVCKAKATKILPPQAASASPSTITTASAVATFVPNAKVMKSISNATQTIRMGAPTEEAKQALNAIIAKDTQTFYMNQRRQREQQQQHPPTSSSNHDQPTRCSRQLDMKEIEHQMNTYHSIDWKQDRCCRVLFDRIPDIRKNSDKRTMWRDKYRPDTVDGLLGYLEDYEHVRDWLIQLKIKSPATAAAATKEKQTKKSKNSIIQQGDDKEAIYNLMLFVGNHGIGKTATVYTAAKETGYSIFEINSSSRRAGRDVTESVGEMTESHLVRFNNNISSKRKIKGETIIIRDIVRTKKPKTIDIAQHFKKMLLLQNGGSLVQELVKPAEPPPPPPPPAPAPAPAPQKNTLEAFFKRAKEKQDLVLEEIANQPKQSLLLFEEVDILFDEDKGFWPAIIDLCQKSKRPIIMTCNDESKIPFDSLNVQYTVYFEKATTQQEQTYLVQYVHLMCYAEHYAIPKREISYLCELVDYDTRQIIDTLQFWLNETPPLVVNEHFVYSCLFAHVMGFSHSLLARDFMQLMDDIKGSTSRNIEICTRYYNEYIAEEHEHPEIMPIEAVTQVLENACFADAWIGLNDKQRNQLYGIDQYNAHQDSYHGNDARMIYKNPSDLDHWELAEIMDNSITVMNLATIIGKSNHLSSHWKLFMPQA